MSHFWPDIKGKWWIRRKLVTILEGLKLLQGWENPLEKRKAIHSSILAWESHGQRSLAGYSPQEHKEPDMTEQLIPPSTFYKIYKAKKHWLCFAWVNSYHHERGLEKHLSPVCSWFLWTWEGDWEVQGGLQWRSDAQWKAEARSVRDWLHWIPCCAPQEAY